MRVWRQIFALSLISSALWRLCGADAFDELMEGIKPSDEGRKAKADDGKPKALTELPMPKGFFLALDSYREAQRFDCARTQAIYGRVGRSYSGTVGRRVAFVQAFAKMVCSSRFPHGFTKFPYHVQSAIYHKELEPQYKFGSSQTDVLFQMFKPTSGSWSDFRVTEIGKDAMYCMHLALKASEKNIEAILRRPRYGCAAVP